MPSNVALGVDLDGIVDAVGYIAYFLISLHEVTPEQQAEADALLNQLEEGGFITSVRAAGQLVQLAMKTCPRLNRG